jgi:hypothetical protein
MADLERDIGKLRGWTCAEIVATGDAEKAQTDADLIGEPMLDLLQMIAAVREHAPVLITPGVVPTPRPPMVIMDTEGTHLLRHYSFAHTYRMTMTASILEELREWGFAALFDAAGRPVDRRSEFETLLVTSMHWIADAERQSQPENRVTSYVTSLEMFFSASDSPIVRDVSEGVAYVLGTTLGARKEIRARISELYGRRSRVSHQGQRGSDAADLYQLKNTSINFLARMSKLAWRFEKREDVRSWIADLRLAGEYVDEVPVSEAEPADPGAIP